MTNAEDFIKDFEELALPHEILDRYDIIEQLAQTDYGETFLISEKESGKRCVLKCYKKSDTHESELLRGLKHKGLPCFIGEFETEDTLFVLREYIDGTTLDGYLTEHRLNEEQTTDIIIELCEILSYLHNQPVPIIHRDIKPSNIVINPNDGKVTLIDFGISRKYSEDAETDTVFIGTQKFAPPEQYGFSQTDCRTDIYALGVVLRYMLTGMVDGKTTVKDKSLARIIAKCTAFSPSDRYKSADALKKSLSNHRKHTTKKSRLR